MTENWVPKVHPATREVLPEDPLTLHASAVPGDPAIMVKCIIQEYASIGWSGEQILALFRDPFFPALHAHWQALGNDRLRAQIGAILARSGVMRFTGTIHDEPEPELVELGVRRPLKDQGESDAAGL